MLVGRQFTRHIMGSLLERVEQKIYSKAESCGSLAWRYLLLWRYKDWLIRQMSGEGEMLWHRGRGMLPK